MWNSSMDLLETIHAAHGRLVRKETDAITAHAEARLLGAATRILAVSLEHARLTNRLLEGSASLPGLTLDAAGDEHVLPLEAQQQAALAESVT
jgi:hypothetical protein